MTKSGELYQKVDWWTVAGLLMTALGLAVVAFFFWQLASSNYQPAWKAGLDLESTGQLGDFVGGMVGSIWALAGVLLFYSALRCQKDEFKLQRKELEDHRREFGFDRCVHVIFRQLENYQIAKQGVLFCPLRFTFTGNLALATWTEACGLVVYDFQNQKSAPAAAEISKLASLTEFLRNKSTRNHLESLASLCRIARSLIDQSEIKYGRESPTFEESTKTILELIVRENVGELVNNYVCCIRQLTCILKGVRLPSSEGGAVKDVNDFLSELGADPSYEVLLESLEQELRRFFLPKDSVLTSQQICQNP